MLLLPYTSAANRLTIQKDKGMRKKYGASYTPQKQ
jgi:hypothetical protein